MILYARLGCYLYPVKMLLRCTILLFCTVMGSGITPISENVRIRLQGTSDGLDSRGEGFAALTEHVVLWNGDDASLPAPDLLAIAKNASEFRGALFNIFGVVELSTQLDAPWNGIAELFVRAESGTLFGVYLVGEQIPRVGATLRAPAVFYKTMEIAGSDGQLRSYPTFVTASVVVATPALPDVTQKMFLLIPALLFVSGILYIVVKNKNKQPPRNRERVHSSDVIEAAKETATQLPDNASDALAAMYEEDELI